MEADDMEKASEKTAIGLVGLGWAGSMHLKAFNEIEGAEVKAVIEIQGQTRGLTRNLVQCIEDFEIPIYFGHKVKRLLGFQAVLILIVGVAYLIALGAFEALSSVYGGSMAFLGAWMLARRVHLATEAAKDMPGREVAILYSGAIQRFAFMFALFIIGLAILALQPVPLLVGFSLSQTVFLFGTRFSR